MTPPPPSKGPLKGPNPIMHLLQRSAGNTGAEFQSNLFNQRLLMAKNLYKKDLVSHFGCVNAIEFSNGSGNHLASGGDDRRVLLWDIEKSISGAKVKPHEMAKQHRSNIFCLSFTNDNRRIFSGGNDDVVILHDIEANVSVDVFIHGKPVYGLSVDPSRVERFATAGEDGRVLLFDVRTNEDTLVMKKHRGAFHSVEFHPLDGNYLATANAKEGAAFWDIRASLDKPLISYGGTNNAQSCMSVRFNRFGTQILALRRRLPPILYRTLNEAPICQFYHPDYYNSCTMKSCCFAGANDEFVLSGSDDFNLYMWRVLNSSDDMSYQWVDNCEMILSGHRSIVNQVRFNSEKCMIASSGVEKIVKLWSTFESEGWTGSLLDESVGLDNSREVFTHEEYLSLVNHGGHNMSHDYSHHSTSEDPRMMAFFDSLVQREIEGWISSLSADSAQSDSEMISSSSDISSRQLSSTSDSPASDVEVQQINYGQFHRRRNNYAAKIPRKKYPNRIAYLIATKRNTLKRLALKGAAESKRRVNAQALRRMQRPPARLTRNGTGKRSGRMNNILLGRRQNEGASTSNNNDTNDRLKKKRKYLQHRRKSSKKSMANTTTENEDDDDDDDDDPKDEDNNRMLPGTSRSFSANEEPTTSRGVPLSRINGESNQHFHPIPSTSTGITNPFHTNDKRLMMVCRLPNVYPRTRPIILSQQDSDDDSDENSVPARRRSPQLNLVRVAPWPQNGAKKLNVYSSSGLDDNEEDVDDDQEIGSADNRLIYQSRHCRKRRHSHHHTHHHNHSHHNHNPVSSAPLAVRYTPTIGVLCSGHSNSRLSSSGQDTDTEFIEQLRKRYGRIPTLNSPQALASSGGSTSVRQHVTPDSGTANITDASPHSTGPRLAGTEGHSSGSNRNNGDLRFFDKKMAAVRRNYDTVFKITDFNSDSE